jgi:hypothetical protein
MRSAFDPIGWEGAGDSTKSSASTRIATSMATEPDPTSPPESSSESRQENLDPEDAASSLPEAGESHGCGARVRRRRRLIPSDLGRIVHGKALQCWATILLKLVAGTTVTVRQFVVVFQLGRERAKLSLQAVHMYPVIRF